MRYNEEAGQRRTSVQGRRGRKEEGGRRIPGRYQPSSGCPFGIRSPFSE
jgi:hypothetical protein